MECLFGRHPVLHLGSVAIPVKWCLADCKSEVFVKIPSSIGRHDVHGSRSHFCRAAKRNSELDFQVLSKPSRILPSTNARICSKSLPEDIISSLELDMYSSYYIIQLDTSKDFGSSFSEINAAILLCLIDDNDNSLLQRIVPVSVKHPVQGKDRDFHETIHFQQGAIDVITFAGSKLGKIQALWIGLESGSWRLDGVHLMVIDGPLQNGLMNNVNEDQFSSTEYMFEANNILLGEGGISVAELRPSFVGELSRENFSKFLTAQSLVSMSPRNNEMIKDDGMKEYADLKFSQLVYVIVLCLTGSWILHVSLDDAAAYSFFIGGVVGLFYLLQLQRSVDGLSSPGISDDNEQKLLGLVGKLNRPWLTSALLVTVSLTLLRSQVANETVAVAPIELFSGIGGFLVSKVAVILAAFRPIRRSSKS